MIPIHEWNNGIRRGYEPQHEAWLAYCRAQLPLLFAKLKLGKNISLVGYGDSITSLGSRSPDQVDAPNGPRRDTLRHFEAYGDDWRAMVPLFNGHHRLGWNWFIKAAIEERWGVPVEYRNWGLAGTTSGTGVQRIDEHDYPNAANSVRLERMLANAPDLVVVCVGMNDIGDPGDTKANLITIGNAIRSAGSEMLVVGTPRQNPNFQSRDDLLWGYTHSKVIAAAREMQVAYVPMDELYGQTGAMGLSRQSHCAASRTNHPGARELAAIGQFMSEIIPKR
jgi:lysophospholipase L1-like esterase